NQVNRAPTLAPIANKTVTETTLLMFTNSATDPDPGPTLTYSLAPGAPTNAAVNTTSGVFSWTPTAAQIGTNNFTVTVTDHGVPPLSDTKSFSVMVEPRPVIQSVALTNDVVTLTWSAIAGQSYRLQFKNSVDDTNWTDAAGNILASGTLCSETNAVNAA